MEYGFAIILISIIFSFLFSAASRYLLSYNSYGKQLDRLVFGVFFVSFLIAAPVIGLYLGVL